MYDVIGDIHGQYAALERLFTALRYPGQGDNRTPRYDTKAFFIGDYIDRGPNSFGVVRSVKRLVEARQAFALLGNHEFNAVLWATEHNGRFLREHNELGFRQHKEFLAEADADRASYDHAIKFFKTLPLFIKDGNDHFVHACWHQKSIDLLRDEKCITPNGVLTEKGWLSAVDKYSKEYDAIEILLKGPEEDLPNGMSYLDAEGTVRRSPRAAWWVDKPATNGDAYASHSHAFSDEFKRTAYMPQAGSITEDMRAQMRAAPEEHKFFIGHYWRRGELSLLSDRVVCVDYCAGRGDRLAAYKLEQNQRALHADNFVSVKVPEPKPAAPSA